MSDTLFFLISKLAGALLRVDTWLMLGVAFMLVSAVRSRCRSGIRSGAVLFGALLLLGVMPLGAMLLQPLERAYPANPALVHVDGIVVPGGAEEPRASAFWGQVQLNDASERLAAALALARKFPAARVVVTGGHPAPRDAGGAIWTEAMVAARFLQEQGLASDRVLVESASRNTAENARRSLALAGPETGETWVLVTTAYQMPRAMHSFAAAGWPEMTAWPVDYRTAGLRSGLGWNLPRNLSILNTAIKEWVGRFVYGWSAR